MNLIKSLAISLGALLLLSGALVTTNAQTTPLTLLTLDSVPRVVGTGDEVTFTGMLTTLDGKPVADMAINIIEQRSGTAAPDVLITATTDEKGMYNATWTADIAGPTTTALPPSAVPTQENDRVMVVWASFSGAPGFAASKSTTQGMTVAIQNMKVSFTFDSQTYLPGQTAKFTLKFSTPSGHPIDPDSTRGIYDGKTVSLERDSEGVYVYKTLALTPPTHTLQVIATKHGYKLYNDAKTLTVFATQTLPGVLLKFDWTPKQVLPGTPVSFMLRFTDLNNVVSPYVNYNFTIRKDNQAVFNMTNQQTTNGTATLTYTFEEGGKYKVTVNINGIGRGTSFIKIIQFNDFDINVIKPSSIAPKVMALQKGDAMRITFRNPAMGASIYTIKLTFEDASKLKVKAPGGWDVSIEGNTVTIKTSDKGLESGKTLVLRVKTQGPVNSFDWSAMDKDDKELKSATAKVIKLRVA